MTQNCVVDCHLHVYWPEKYPYPEGPGRRPEPGQVVGDPEALVRTLAAHQVTHALLVQPSAYGNDNRAMVDMIGMSDGRMKGIAVLDVATTREELRDLKSKGVVGVRLNLFSFANDIFDNPGIDSFMARCADNDLFIEAFVTPATWPKVIDKLRSCPASVVVEHLGWPALSEGIEQPAFQLLLSLAESNRCTVKLSCFRRMSDEVFPFDDVEPYVKKLLATFGPERCMWGSDWPMYGTAHGSPNPYVEELQAIERWIPDAVQLKKVLWETPAQLFDFHELSERAAGIAVRSTSGLTA